MMRRENTTELRSCLIQHLKKHDSKTKVHSIARDVLRMKWIYVYWPVIEGTGITAPVRCDTLESSGQVSVLSLVFADARLLARM